MRLVQARARTGESGISRLVAEISVPEGTEVPEVHPQMIFSAKTGTAEREEGSVTWLAGHVECPDREYVFVSRVISPEPPSKLSPAVAHGLAALGELGVLRCEDRG